MNDINSTPPQQPILVVGGKAFDLSKIDFSNPGNNPELMSHLEAWTKKKEKSFARAEKKRPAARKASPTSRTSKARSGNIRFLTFVKSNPPTDPAMKSFYTYVAKAPDFPQSSDPRVLATYLYLKLDHLQTKGFQLYMIAYNEQHNTQFPKGLQDHTEFLDAINAIVYLQNNDPHYRYS